MARPWRDPVSPRSCSTCIATAVEESAKPPPRTIEAGPLSPVTAITVYATTASVAHTWRAHQRNFQRGLHSKAHHKPTCMARHCMACTLIGINHTLRELRTCFLLAIAARFATQNLHRRHKRSCCHSRTHSSGVYCIGSDVRTQSPCHWREVQV